MTTSELVALVKGSMPVVSGEVGEVGPLNVWPRPPLLSGLKLKGVDLDTALPVVATKGPAEMADVYEEFIHGYLIGDELAHRRPYQWLRANMGLAATDAARYTPVKLLKRRTTPGDWLIILLWVIYRSVPGATFEAEGDTVVVRYPDNELGFKNGILFSCHTPNRRLEVIPDHQTILRQPALGERGTTRLATLNRYYLIAGKQEEGEALQLALRILYWRIGDPNRLEYRLRSRSAPTPKRP